MKIKIFGSGCRKCDKLTVNVNKALSQLELEADVKKITDIKQMVENGIMGTPALKIDDKIVSTGRVLSVKQIVKLLQA